MSKRRKYDGKNKRSFIIILVLSIAIIGIFSLFIYNYSKISNIEYVIESGSVLQDIERNYFNIDDDAILKVRWDGSYYLIYNDRKIILGKKVIAYNAITTHLKMYGSFYEIASDGKIIENKNENILNNTSLPKFYKIDDREYLLVDGKINSSDNSIETNNYLLVQLDKMGNAKLSNNVINLKTISPTTLFTSSYTFDIANEILNFGQYDIDLKKIIGSTNQYVPEAIKDKDNNGSNNNSGSDGNDQQNGGGGNNVSGGNTGLGNGLGSGIGAGPGDIVNDSDVGNIPDVDDVINKFKKYSIINIVAGITQIDVDYVIYDPYNEYKSVYLELSSAELGVKEKVYLSKNDTLVTLGDLVPNSEYNLVFMTVSTNVDENGNEVTVFPEVEDFVLRTRALEYGMSIYKMSFSESKLMYKISLQKDFDIDSANVVVDIEYADAPLECRNIKDSVTISNDDLYRGYVFGDIPVSGCKIDDDTLFNLKIVDVSRDGKKIAEIGKEFSYKLGGVQ